MTDMMPRGILGLPSIALGISLGILIRHILGHIDKAGAVGSPAGGLAIQAGTNHPFPQQL